MRTEIPMREMCPLGNPVARSQARRILRRLDEFEEIIFDFQGIDFMGQGLQMKYSGYFRIDIHQSG